MATDYRMLKNGDSADGNTWYQMDGYSTKPVQGSKWTGSAWSNPNLMSFDQLYSKANPWADQAPKYQAKLSDLLQNPGSMTSNPAYRFAFDQGMEAINRTAAAKGQLNSGNRLMDLTKYGQGLASQQFMSLADLYSTLAGAKNQNAAGAVSAAASGVNGQQMAMNGVKPVTMSSGMDLSNFWVPQLY